MRQCSRKTLKACYMIRNLFTSSGNNQLRLSLLDINVLYRKYFLSSQKAIRLKFSLHKSDNHFENSIPSDITSSSTVTDKLDRSSTDFKIIFGYEKRRGSGRLQFLYGSEISFGVSSNGSKYTYGNAFSTSNTFPTTTINFSPPASTRISVRTTESKISSGSSMGLRVFAGIEYFMFPKISIGGEIGLGYYNNFGGKNINNIEYWNFSTGLTKNNNQIKTSSSTINSDILNGQIFILFYVK